MAAGVAATAETGATQAAHMGSAVTEDRKGARGASLRPRVVIAIPGPSDGPPVIFCSRDSDRRDRFGLPMDRPTLLHPQEEHDACERAVVTVVHDAFASAVRLLGEDAARALFRKVAAGKRGSRPGPRAPSRDAAWLREYDCYVAQLPPGGRPNLSEFARSLLPQLPMTMELQAALVHMRRLLKRRDVEARRQQRFAREMERLGFGKTLLEEATHDDK